jgi:hypothetical protein
LTWQKEWDFNARELTLEQGFPSRLGFTLQPRINRLDIFGTVGKFRARDSGFVGFAQLSANLSLPTSSALVKVTLSSRTPATEIRLVLFSTAFEKGSYQVSIAPEKEIKEFFFRSEDFAYYLRGHLDNSAESLEFAKVDRLGFLVTRSSQTSAEELVSFDFSVHAIEILR